MARPKTINFVRESKNLLKALPRHLQITQDSNHEVPNFSINWLCPASVKTDLTNNTGVLIVEEGAARVVKLALLTNYGPSGFFFSQY
ncbi:hypothetical protein ACFX2A_000558 [Malus domestica]